MRGHHPGSAGSSLRAAVVVGADGAHSHIARKVGARAYREHPPLTAVYYSYWSGLRGLGASFHARPGQLILVWPTNDDLTCIYVAWPTVAGSFVFSSGTVGIDPATGMPGDGIEAQTELALRNLDAILNAAGASLSTLLNTTIFYTNVEDFAAINAVYARLMPDPPPARSAPANVRLPRGLLISIDGVAELPSA